MASVTITIQFEGGRRADLELPADVPAGILLPEVLGALGMKGLPGRLAYQGRALADQETLEDASVLTGGILQLTDASGRAPRTGAELILPSGRRVPLNPDVCSELSLGRFGRPGPKDIDLSDECEGDTVSRAHATLRWQGSDWKLEVLPSLNKTSVNDQVIEPGHGRLLHSGDRIRLGLVELLIQ